VLTQLSLGELQERRLGFAQRPSGQRLEFIRASDTRAHVQPGGDTADGHSDQ
jgi:hypothetical protein